VPPRRNIKTQHEDAQDCARRALSGRLPGWIKLGPQTATELVRSSLILLQKSFGGDERNFLRSLMRFVRRDVRDLVAHQKNGHGASYRRHRVLQRRSRPKFGFREIFGVRPIFDFCNTIPRERNSPAKLAMSVFVPERTASRAQYDGPPPPFVVLYSEKRRFRTVNSIRPSESCRQFSTTGTNRALEPRLIISRALVRASSKDRMKISGDFVDEIRSTKSRGRDGIRATSILKGSTIFHHGARVFKGIIGTYPR
jgi:hypothetical protein